MLNIAGSREGPYVMLEPDAGKLASPVLRGRGGGNIALLPGPRILMRSELDLWSKSMTQSKNQLVWSLFVEARKEILENQKTRTQIIGFKITFVSSAAGLIAANIDKVPPILLVIPAIATVFFDLLITSYSFAIKRTGDYCHKNIEPLIKKLYEWPNEFLLWEEYMRQPDFKHSLSFRGNIGFTVLTIAPAIYVLLKHSPLAPWLSWVIIVLLVLLLVYDIWEYYRPRRAFRKER
jgi:hypothetical protein